MLGITKNWKNDKLKIGFGYGKSIGAMTFYQTSIWQMNLIYVSEYKNEKLCIGAITFYQTSTWQISCATASVA